MDSQNNFESLHSNTINTSNGNIMHQDDLAMSIFLNQGADFHSQSMASGNDIVPVSEDTPESYSEMEGDLSCHEMGLEQISEPQFTELFQSTVTDAPSSASASSSRKAKGKKASSGQHSSLLNVFANPLLHAIPVLARNCINFEDFLAQAAQHGQNGLLGPKESRSDTDRTQTEKAFADKERSMMLKIQSPWRIRVLGLPASGAKSRVETQIKICLQLVDSNGDLATNWDRLHLPDHMVVKDKLKRKSQKSVTTNHPSAVESKTLKLEAAVVCDGQPDNEIIMCTNCVHRERKRLKRKRDSKLSRAINKEGNAAKLAALTANDLPDLTDENVMAEERRKILMFNCPEYVEFQNGETTLPTRITCYCRHHNEKVGFHMVFTIKDSCNHVVATGRSPPIMITDDHKSSKLQAAPRKRSRAEFDTVANEAESPFKKKANKSNAGHTEGDTDSGTSSPMASGPSTPTSPLEEIPNSPMASKPDSMDPPTIDYGVSSATSRMQMTEHTMSHPERPTSVTGSQSFLSHMHESSLDLSMTQISNGPLYDFINAQDINMDQLLPQSTSHDPSPLLQMPPNSYQQQSLPGTHHTQQPISSSHQLITQHNQRKPGNFSTCEQQYQLSNMYAKMQEKATSNTGTPNTLPKLHRLIPSEGPVYGGSEVTVLGANFYEGLTCMFGENPAIPTHCWSTNTLLCILPPASGSGPVVVSFKEHPTMHEGQDVVLFTYFDESDRALMELALQVVGLKTIGKVEDARQIAMRIVQGDSNSRKGQPISAASIDALRIDHRHGLTIRAATAVYDNARALFIGRLEEQVIAALAATKHLNTRYLGDISLTNRNQHSLLHLAALCGYDRLVQVLLQLGCDVDKVDNNGFTALHFASWTGKEAIVRALIHKANLDVRNISGKTAEKLALEAGHESVVRLFQQAPRRRSPKKRQDPRSIRRPLTDFIPSETVATAKAFLPVSITNILSNFYTFSVNTSHAKNLVHTVGQVYNFMLDPF